MKTIDDCWQEFDSMVMPKGASLTQQKERRRCFYAGVYTILQLFFDLTLQEENKEEASVVLLENLHKECLEFAAELQAGRA